MFNGKDFKRFFDAFESQVKKNNTEMSSEFMQIQSEIDKLNARIDELKNNKSKMDLREDDIDVEKIPKWVFGVLDFLLGLGVGILFSFIIYNLK